MAATVPAEQAEAEAAGAARVALLIIWDVVILPDGTESAYAHAVEIVDREQLDRLVRGAEERGCAMK